jgi:signal transduction histidine kinase
MRKIYIQLIVSVFFSINAYTQNASNKELDSMLQVFTTQIELKKAQTSRNISSYYVKHSQFYKSIEYLLIGQKIVASQKRKDLARKQKNVALFDISIGSSYFHLGDHKKAMEYFIKAYKVIPKDTQLLGNIAVVFSQQANYERAIYYINIAEKIGLETDSELNQIWLLKGGFYIAKKDTINGIKFINKSIEFSNKKQDFVQLAVTYNALGGFTRETSKKIEYYNKSKELWDKYQPDDLYAVVNNISIAEYYIEISKNPKILSKNKITKAEYLIKAEKLLLQQVVSCNKMKHSGEYLQESLKSLSLVYEAKKDFQNAHKYYKKSTVLFDSLNSIEVRNKILNVEASNNIEEKNKQIKINKLSIEAKEKQKWYLLGGLGLLTIIGGLLFYQSRKRQQTNQKLQLLNENLDTKNHELDQANKAKTRFFSILNHDLRGPVANLIFFLQLQNESPEMLDQESTKRMQDKTMAGAENLLASMEDILQWSKSQMENFKPQPKKLAINQLFDDTKKVFSGYLKITFEYHNPDAIEIFTDENYLKTIVRNLTSNAINVFTTTENPLIIWKAWQENGKSFLSITDNGSGAHQEKLKALFDETEVASTKSGLGLHLIRDMAKAIDCEIVVDSKVGIGTTFTLKL